MTAMLAFDAAAEALTPASGSQPTEETNPEV
jgi:hypothetical protein